MADALLIWRMYIAWDRSKLILILPALAYTIGFICTMILLVYTILMAVNGTVVPYSNLYAPLSLVAMATTIFLAWYVTIATCSRLWYLRRELMKYSDRPNPYMRIIIALVESGGSYRFTLMALVTTYRAGSYHDGVRASSNVARIELDH